MSPRIDLLSTYRRRRDDRLPCLDVPLGDFVETVLNGLESRPGGRRFHHRIWCPHINPRADNLLSEVRCLGRRSWLRLGVKAGGSVVTASVADTMHRKTTRAVPRLFQRALFMGVGVGLRGSFSRETLSPQSKTFSA